MLHEFKGKLENFVYWSNGCGELHHNGEYDIPNEEDLPQELQRAYNELWSEGYGVNCYLAEFNGKFGIALEASYDDCFAHDLKITYEKLVSYAKNNAVACANKYPEYDVIFGEDSVTWNDGTKESVVMVIVPWDSDKAKVNEIAKTFEAICYSSLTSIRKAEEMVENLETRAKELEQELQATKENLRTAKRQLRVLEWENSVKNYHPATMETIEGVVKNFVDGKIGDGCVVMTDIHCIIYLDSTRGETEDGYSAEVSKPYECRGSLDGCTDIFTLEHKEDLVSAVMDILQKK